MAQLNRRVTRRKRTGRTPFAVLISAILALSTALTAAFVFFIIDDLSRPHVDKLSFMADKLFGEALEVTPVQETAETMQAFQKGESSQTENVQTEHVKAETLVAKTKPADDSYFDDAVFIGDSVTYKLELYAQKNRNTEPNFLGKAQFLTNGSLGTHNAKWEISDKSVHPKINGQKVLIQDGVEQLNAKKVYIQLGMNDIGLYGVDDSITTMDELAQEILKKSPDAKIYIQSVTPMVTNAEGKNLNNSNINIYNEKLLELCGQKGYYYIDVASVMKDSDGSLIMEYCSDPDGQGIHLTDAGCKAWVDYLYTHTA